MSSTDLVARRYALALFGASKDLNSLESVSSSFSSFSNLLNNVPKEFYKALLDPTVSKKDLFSCISLALKGSPDIVRNFIGILIQEGRLKFISRIEYYFQVFLMDLKGECVANIYSAYDLSENFCNKLKEVLSEIFNKKVLLKVHLDSSLLGGFVIEASGVRLDASISGTLGQLSHYMKGAL